MIPALQCRLALVAAMLLALAGCVEKKATLAATDEGRFAFPAENSYWEGEQVDLAGILEFPEETGDKVPAMVIVHGAAGMGYRGDTWGAFLREHGIATFRIDYLRPRGLSRATPDGPRSAYDIYAALKVLATHPRIDSERIGIMGFSRGGTMTLLALDYRPEDTGGVHPGAFVALYPGCAITFFGKKLPDVPILILVGDEDQLSPASDCEVREREAKRHGKDVTTVVYAGGYHGFDDNRSRNVQWGAQTVRMQADPALAEQARADVLALLRRAFGPDAVS